MKMLLSVAALAVLLGSLGGCSSCDKTPGCDDNRMFGLGMFHKKHLGFGGRGDCDACATGAPLGIAQSASYGGESGAILQGGISGSNCNCQPSGGHVSETPMMSEGIGSGNLPAGTIIQDSAPTMAPALGGRLGGSLGGSVPGPE